MTTNFITIYTEGEENNAYNLFNALTKTTDEIYIIALSDEAKNRLVSLGAPAHRIRVAPEGDSDEDRVNRSIENYREVTHGVSPIEIIPFK